jgi:hypothetical protein
MEKVIDQLAKHNWDFILYKTECGFVMNVVFNSSFADYSRSFRVSETEASQDMEGLKKLSAHIRSNYDQYIDREITPVVRK